jgi:hypothetical protein
MSDDIHAINRALAAERRTPSPPRSTEPQQIRDLRAVIHILAQAMNSKARPT